MKKIWILGLGVFLVHDTYSEVVLTAPTIQTELAAEEYPESYFGKRPDVVQVQEQGRAPAGIQFEETQVNTMPLPAPNSFSQIVPDRAKGVQEVGIIAGDLGFFPHTVFVTMDIPVRLFVTGSSKNTLCLMLDTFNVKRQVRSYKIEEITFTPKTPGKYRFYCPVNGMEGTLVVRETLPPLAQVQ